MYKAHPTHGAGTRPHRTQLKTAARKTTLNAGQCVRQPREGRGRNRQAPPPPQKKERRGEGEKARKQPTAAKLPANTTTGGQAPPQKAPKTGPPHRHRGTAHPKPATPSQWKRTTGKRDTEKKKKRATSPARKKGDGWTQTPKPGKKKKEKKKPKRKKHTPTTHPRRAGHRRDPGPAHTPTPHAGTGNSRGASGAPTKPHTSQKQAETEAQPRTPQTADTRGTTPQTVPKHTHPRPQPGLAGLTKPAPNRQPDPNTNATQQ